MCAESASYREDIVKIVVAIDSLEGVATVCFRREIQELVQKVRTLTSNAEELENEAPALYAAGRADHARGVQFAEMGA